jgi:hypothetical protein
VNATPPTSSSVGDGPAIDLKYRSAIGSQVNFFRNLLYNDANISAPADTSADFVRQILTNPIPE